MNNVIKDIANVTGMSEKSVKSVFNALENCVIHNIYEADSNESVNDIGFGIITTNNENGQFNINFNFSDDFLNKCEVSITSDIDFLAKDVENKLIDKIISSYKGIM